MTLLLPSFVRSGLIAIGLTVGLSAPAMAGAAGFVTPPVEPQRLAAAGSGDVAGQVIDVGNRAWRRYPRRHHRRHFRGFYGPSFSFSLGIPSYRYAQPYRYVRPYQTYRYIEPRRRVYRSYGSSNAHVRWCYDRYRSYRAWDNTYQPYDGPRRRCWSPYS